MTDQVGTTSVWYRSNNIVARSKRQAKIFKRRWPSMNIYYHPSKLERIIEIVRGKK